jgi:hypothetical protein
MQRIAIVPPLTLNELNDGTMDCNDRCSSCHDWACHIANRLRRMMSRCSAVALDGSSPENKGNRRIKLVRSYSEQENRSGNSSSAQGEWQILRRMDPKIHSEKDKLRFRKDKSSRAWRLLDRRSSGGARGGRGRSSSGEVPGGAGIAAAVWQKIERRTSIC